MSPSQQSPHNKTAVAESTRSIDDLIKSSAVASTTGAIAAVRQPRASSAPRREEPRSNSRRVSSDVVVTSTKHVAKPWKHERAAMERRGHSQTGEVGPSGQGSEPRLTHERLQQYAAAHARLTAAPRHVGPRSTAGSTLLRKVTNLSSLLPTSPAGGPQQQSGAPSPTGAVAAAAMVRTVASAPVLSPAALAGARLALTTAGIPLPGMAAPTGARPASAQQRPQSPHHMLQRLISFPQAQPALFQQQQQQQRQQGAPPPERAFGPRAADYPTRRSLSPRPVLHGHGSGGGGSGEYSWQHQPHPPLNAKQRSGDPRVGAGRGQNASWTHQQAQGAIDSPLGSPAGHGQGQGQGHGHGGWGPLEAQYSAGYLEAAAAAAVAAAGGRADESPSPPGSPRRSRSPSPPPPPLLQPPPHKHGGAGGGGGAPFHQLHSSTELPQLPSPHTHPPPAPPHPPALPPAVAQQHLHQQSPQTPHDRRLRPWTPRNGRPQSSGPRPGSARYMSTSSQGQQQQQQRSGEVVVVGLRDVPPSQLPFARAVVEPERAAAAAAAGEGGPGYWGHGQQRQQRPVSSRSSDNGTHASWWQRPAGGGDSEASYPLTAVTDRHAVGDDDMSPSEAAVWLARMAELEAEVLEEREFRRKYEEELQMLAAAATMGGRGGRPSGGGPMLWQTTGGRVLSGARAAAAAVMRHRAGGVRS